MLSMINFYLVKSDTIMEKFSIASAIVIFLLCLLILPITYFVSKRYSPDDEKKFSVLADGYHFKNLISRLWNFL